MTGAMTRSKAPKHQGALQRVSVEGDLTIRRASELKSALLARLEQEQQSGPVEIDLSQVSSLDCAGLQLLLLARRTADANGIELHFVGHSPAAIEVCDLLGLSAALDAPFVARAGEST